MSSKRMSWIGRWGLMAALVTAAYAGGVLSAQVGHAGTENSSPYAPLSQMAEVLVRMENYYVDPVQRQKAIDGAIKGMVAELDPHSAFMTAKEFVLFNQDTEGTFGGIGVEVDFKDDFIVVIAPIPSSPAARAGIRSGDLIVAVDGKLLRGMAIDKIVRLMRGAAKTKVRVTVKRKGVREPLHFDMVREHIHVRSVESKRMAEGIAYLRLKQFQQGTHQELLEEIGKVRRAGDIRGVILDMRNNPGGLIDEAQAVADELLSGGPIYSTRHRGRIVDDVRAHHGGALSRMPVVLMVNQYSASSTELVAGAVQDQKRAPIIGARTFGKGSVQTIYQLPGGAGLRLTTMRYYTPSGRAIQAAGILPDVLVNYKSDEDLVWREDDLEGHLAPEQAEPTRANAKVLTGDKAPEYAPIDKVPSDPRGKVDFALEVAFNELRTQLSR
jgi:carboxyl-terminal processing protease